MFSHDFSYKLCDGIFSGIFKPFFVFHNPLMPSSPKLWNRQYFKTWCANFAIFFSFWLIMPLLPIYLSEQFAADKDVIGLVLSGYTWMAMFSRAFSGWLVDNFPRKAVLMSSWLLFSLFFAGYFFTGSLLIFGIVRTLHGGPFGTLTVSNSTVAIDVLPVTRRAEGIGYYGLSNNLATALAPTLGLILYAEWHNFDLIFGISLVVALAGMIADSSLLLPDEVRVSHKGNRHFSPREIFLFRAWPEGIDQACYSMAYGIVVSYLAIYGKEELGIAGGTGLFFAVLSTCLVISRLTGTRSLREGRVVHNCSIGIVTSLLGFFLFASLHNYFGYFACAALVGLGNGRMFPAFQSMFVNMAGDRRRGVANSTQLSAWDVGQGLGVIAGGAMVQLSGYSAAFWLSFAAQFAGVVFFFTYVKRHYLSSVSRQ